MTIMNNINREMTHQMLVYGIADTLENRYYVLQGLRHRMFEVAEGTPGRQEYLDAVDAEINTLYDKAIQS